MLQLAVELGTQSIRADGFHRLATLDAPWNWQARQDGKGASLNSWARSLSTHSCSFLRKEASLCVMTQKHHRLTRTRVIAHFAFLSCHMELL